MGVIENQDEGKAEKEEKEQVQNPQESKYSIAQLGYTVKELGDIIKKWDTATNIHEANLVQMIKDLREENFILNKLPEKVSASLKEIVPDVSNHIQKRVLKDFENSLALCNRQLATLDDKISEANKKVEIYQNKQLKKKLIDLGLNLLLLIVVGCGSSYMMSNYLLNKRGTSPVFLKPLGDVNISNSNVSILESSGKMNIDGSKKKRGR
jgi:hypothetical protein